MVPQFTKRMQYRGAQVVPRKDIQAVPLVWVLEVHHHVCNLLLLVLCTSVGKFANPCSSEESSGKSTTKAATTEDLLNGEFA